MRDRVSTLKNNLVRYQEIVGETTNGNVKKMYEGFIVAVEKEIADFESAISYLEQKGGAN